MANVPGPRRVVAAVQRRLLRRIRSVYYVVGFGRRFPGKAAFERWLARWEVEDQRGDVPKGKDRWEAQYESAGWEYLSGIGEVAHYAVIVGYGQFFKPGGSVIDVGCGAGVLHERWLPQGYSRYVGVDISETAVQGLQEAGYKDTSFVAANAEEFDPAERFDLVVFNEAITYFEDPAGGFEHYLRFLAPDGVVIVSCHEQSVRAQAILRDLLERYPVLDQTLVRQSGVGWRVAAFRPRSR